MLSKDCVDWEFADGTGRPGTWESCYARTELLPELLETCFTREERTLIVPVRLKTGDNPVYGTRGGADTIDSLFLLSMEEFQKYVAAEAASAPLYLIESETFAEEEFIYELCNENTVWWLRTPGEEQNCFAAVDRDGSLDLAGYENSCDEIGIRPAVWIDTELMPEMEEDLPFP